MLWKRLFPLFFAFSLFGCTTKFLYSNLDWFVLEYLDDYVSLNHEQEDILEISLKNLSDWHRINEIPAYLEHLNELELMAPKTVDAAYISIQTEKFQKHAERIISKASPNLYALANQLNPEQIDELLENIAKKHEEYREKYENMDEPEIREAYQERREDNLTKWLGKLSKEQKSIINSWSEDMMITNFELIKHSEKMLTEMQSLFSRRDEIRYFQSTFIRMIEDPNSFYTDSLKEKFNHNSRLANERIANVINAMDKKQIEYYKEKIRDWKKIAQDLSKTQ